MKWFTNGITVTHNCTRECEGYNLTKERKL